VVDCGSGAGFKGFEGTNVRKSDWSLGVKIRVYEACFKGWIALMTFFNLEMYEEALNLCEKAIRIPL
jgi:hypothetical protein